MEHPLWCVQRHGGWFLSMCRYTVTVAGSAPVLVLNVGIGFFNRPFGHLSTVI
jgi:hypothetical protein